MRLISGSSSHKEHSPLKGSVSLLTDAESAKTPTVDEIANDAKLTRQKGDGTNGSLRDRRDKARALARQRRAANGAVGWLCSALIADDEPVAQEALKSML